MAYPIQKCFLDLGNTTLRILLDGGYGFEISMRHAIRVLTDAEMRGAQARARRGSSSFMHSAQFEHKGEMVQVGQIAQMSGSSRPIQGAQKFTKGYYDRLMLALLIKAFPNGHDNLELRVAMPANMIDYADDMKKSLGGSRTVKLADGRSIKYVITAVAEWDESVGGVYRYLLSPTQSETLATMPSGARLVYIDMGGRVSSMTQVVLNRTSAGRLVPEVLYGSNDMEIIEDGIELIKERLTENLRSMHREYFQVTSIPDNLLERALSTRCVMVDGERIELDVSQAVMNATAPMLDAIERGWRVKMRAGLDVYAVPVGGGGGGLFFNDIAEIVNHKRVEMIETPDQMYLGNLRGAYLAYQNEIQNRI